MPTAGSTAVCHTTCQALALWVIELEWPVAGNCSSHRKVHRCQNIHFLPWAACWASALPFVSSPVEKPFSPSPPTFSFSVRSEGLSVGFLSRILSYIFLVHTPTSPFRSHFVHSSTYLDGISPSSNGCPGNLVTVKQRFVNADERTTEPWPSCQTWRIEN